MARTWRLVADVLVGFMMAFALVGVALSARGDGRRGDHRPGPVGRARPCSPRWWSCGACCGTSEVTTRTLQGAISAYLLIPVAFQFVFHTVDALLPGGFFGSPKPPTAFMYFSLTTVTTVGYGDLAPASDVGRLLATVEALLGQVFLVTFVALLVGLLGERWRTNRSAAGPDNDGR